MSGDEQNHNFRADARDRNTILQALGDINIRVSKRAGFMSVLAAAVGAVALYAFVFDGTEQRSGLAPQAQRSGAGDFGSATTETPPGAPPEAATGSGSSDAPQPPAEQWRGTLVLGLQSPKELDSDPPSTPGLFGGGDISIGLLDSWQVMPGIGRTVTQWTGDGRTPGHADCAEATDAGSSTAPASSGTVLCVRTDEGRVARLVVTKLSEGVLTSVEMDAVIWEPSADAT
ncbi:MULTISPECIES: hypothetical protein [unclassified Streptomyces]|uniref:hypothetical protein n=1 Tax=unclassified Streptomyces TaxID=2593676 RepID=UPI00093B1B4C|nr:hypothetical protein [Streptomyces sp. CB02400]OKK13535.1 hypothetical protein AMK33_01470 [Streptomyces sp. CB02400]